MRSGASTRRGDPGALRNPAYWTTGGATFDEDAKEFFGLAKEDKLLGFFYVGYVETPSVAGKRRPVEDKTIWVRE